MSRCASSSFFFPGQANPLEGQEEISSSTPNVSLGIPHTPATPGRSGSWCVLRNPSVPNRYGQSVFVCLVVLRNKKHLPQRLPSRRMPEQCYRRVQSGVSPPTAAVDPFETTEWSVLFLLLLWEWVDAPRSLPRDPAMAVGLARECGQMDFRL